MKYVVVIPEIVLLVATILTLALFASIYPITIPWKPVFASPDTLTLRPNAAGTYQAWGTFGAPPSHWEGTSDQNDATGVQSPTGSTTAKETENLQDTSQTGTINSVTAYMRAKATSSTETLYAHSETTTIGASTYYLLKLVSADATGTTLSADAGTIGRKLMGKFVYQLTSVSSIPASTWTIYYRAYKGHTLVGAHGDVDILIRMSNDTIRSTIATNVANSGDLTTSWSTLSGTYSWAPYTVANQTDYLEIDYYIEVTAIKAGYSVYLRIDDNTLPVADQTRAINVDFVDENATLIWKLGATEVEAGGVAISRTAFTDYNNQRTTDPGGGSWEWSDINSLEIGVRAPTVGTSEYIQVSEFWIVVDYTDTTPPTYSNIGVSTTLAGQSCLFYTLWNDNLNMSQGTFGTNNTGSWINETVTLVWVNSTATWSNVTKTLNSTAGVVVQWCIWANDTSNNWNNTGIQSFTIILGYSLNLRVMDWDLTDNIQGAYVYKDTDVKVSDANGWANWTLQTGTVQIKVQYFGFWVNGTFSVTMDSDKTIDVQCNLYDVTVLVQESVQNAYLASANVTVYNSTSVQGNKITSGITGNNGQVQLLNLPNNTLTFTQYGGASYSLVIGNTTQLVSSENQTITLTADQNSVNTNNNYSIIAFIGMTIPLKGGFRTKRLKRRSIKREKVAK